MYWLSSYLDPVTLTYILSSNAFYTFYVDVKYLLNYKAYNHQTLHSASQCTDSAGMYLDSVTLTYISCSIDFYAFSRGPALVAQLDAPSDWRPGGRWFKPRRGRQHSFMEIDHEIFSTVILPLPLIQEGQLSVSDERMCTILVNRLED